MNSQYDCRKCGAIVIVYGMMVYSPKAKAALARGLCRDCYGNPQVKHL